MKIKLVLFIFASIILTMMVSCKTNSELPTIGIKAFTYEENGSFYIDLTIKNVSSETSHEATFDEGNIYRYEISNQKNNISFTGTSYESGIYKMKVGSEYLKKILIGRLENGEYDLIVETISNEGTHATIKSSFVVASK